RRGTNSVLKLRAQPFVSDQKPRRHNRRLSNFLYLLAHSRPNSLSRYRKNRANLMKAVFAPPGGRSLLREPPYQTSVAAAPESASPGSQQVLPDGTGPESQVACRYVQARCIQAANPAVRQISRLRLGGW